MEIVCIIGIIVGFLAGWRWARCRWEKRAQSVGFDI